MQSRLVDDAPDLVKQMLTQAMLTFPQGSASVRAWVSLTFGGRSATGRKREAHEVIRDLATQLLGLTHGLGATGAGSARPASAQTICEIVRVAYDPAAATILDDARLQGHVPDLDWTDAGQAATESTWDTYRAHHDPGLLLSRDR